MQVLRPLVFVGSSSEGRDVADAIQLNLDRDCEVVVWDQGVFGLSQGTLEALVETAEQFDVAILVVTPDDLIESRGTSQQAPRDNVLIEIGLFVGTLGREQTFVVFERNANVKLPSDLAGVTLAGFQRPVAGPAAGRSRRMLCADQTVDRQTWRPHKGQTARWIAGTLFCTSTPRRGSRG
jgi:predicted nucleotide-binding protein